MIHALPDLFFVFDPQSPPKIGALNLGTLCAVGTRMKVHPTFGFGFMTEEFPANTDIRTIALTNTQTLFITTRHHIGQNDSWIHCVRLKEIIAGKDAAWVMNPNEDISVHMRGKTPTVTFLAYNDFVRDFGLIYKTEPNGDILICHLENRFMPPWKSFRVKITM